MEQTVNRSSWPNRGLLYSPTVAFSQSDIRAIISAPYLFGVVTFVLFAVATPNKYGDLLFESRVTSRRLREWMSPHSGQFAYHFQYPVHISYISCAILPRISQRLTTTDHTLPCIHRPFACSRGEISQDGGRCFDSRQLLPFRRRLEKDLPIMATYLTYIPKAIHDTRVVMTR